MTLNELISFLSETELNLREDLEEYSESEETTLEHFYDVGLDRDGVPISYGNANDVYDDGFANGEKQGKLEIVRFVLENLKNKETQTP